MPTESSRHPASGSTCLAIWPARDRCSDAFGRLSPDLEEWRQVLSKHHISNKGGFSVMQVII